MTINGLCLDDDGAYHDFLSDHFASRPLNDPLSPDRTASPMTSIDITADLFPLHGDHTPETIWKAAAAVSEIWRYLSHATFQHGRMTAPETAVVLAELRQATEHAADVLHRLADHTFTTASDSDPHDVLRGVRARLLAESSGEMRQAALAARRLAGHLVVAEDKAQDSIPTEITRDS